MACLSPVTLLIASSKKLAASSAKSGIGPQSPPPSPGGASMAPPAGCASLRTDASATPATVARPRKTTTARASMASLQDRQHDLLGRGGVVVLHGDRERRGVGGHCGKLKLQRLAGRRA